MALDQVKRIDNILHGPILELPENRKGLGRTIFDKLQEYKNNTLLVDTASKNEWTYGETNQKCTRIALHMRDIFGVKEDDIVLSCAGNIMESILPIYSALYLNAVTTTLDPTISLRDTTHLLKNIPPKVIFVVEDAVELIENALLQLDVKPKIVVMGRHKTHVTLSEFLKPHPDENKFIPHNVQDIKNVGVIFFSSGTTGLPKGVCHSHNSMLKACYTFRIASIDVSVVVYYTSFYWISAFMFSTIGLLAGGKRLIPQPFTPESYLGYIQEYKVTRSFLSTTYALQLNDNNTKGFQTDSLPELLVGGSVLTIKHLQQLARCFPKTKIYTGYGQTEICGLGSAFTKFSWSLLIDKIGSAGVPYFNLKIKIVDLETRKTLGPNQKGEICILTNTPFVGYYNKDSEDSFDDEGYIKTGDAGYYDEDNCLYFSDRLKEMFKFQSWHLVPASLERVIYDHPAVLETVVIGIPHELDDHHAFGLVTLKDGYTITEEELLNYVNSKLTDREKLRAGLKIIKNFPKTCTGKIARQTTRQIALNGNLTEFY